MDEVHDSIKTLLQDINTPTEERESQAIPEPVAEEIKEEIKTEAATTIKEDAKKEIDLELCDSGAEIVIGMFDLIQNGAFGAVGLKKKKNRLKRLYGDDAPDKLDKLIIEISAANKNKVTSTIKEFTPDDYGMLQIEQVFNEYIDDLGLTDDEKNILKKPLIAIMKKKGGAIPAEILLLLAFLQITGARVAELTML